MHVAHFRPMCLTAQNSLRHPKTPIMSRTCPTRVDVWSSRGGRLERTLGGRPHVLGRRVVCRKGVHLVSFMPPPTRAGILGVGGVEGVVCAPVCTPQSHKGVAWFAGFAHYFGIQSLWASQIYG